MSQKTIRRIGSFEATDDQGKLHEVTIYQTFIKAGSRGGTQEVAGLKSLELGNGSAVNRIGQGEYEVVATGAKLRSDDPNAP